MSNHRITSQRSSGKHDAKMVRLVALIAALAAGSAITEALADTVTFRHGASSYTGGVDTMLQQDPANAGTNNGAATAVGWDGDDPGGTGFDVYTLIRFNSIFGSNPGQIPFGAQITSATLTYTVSDTGDTGSMHALLLSWTAASTFNSFCGASCDEGTEFGPAVANAPASALGTQTVDVRTSLQSWSDGATNNGWVVVPTGAGGVDIRSNEHTTLTERPLLTVVFNQGAPTANIVRQPYLQMASETSMTIAWRTDTATNSHVRYGTAVGVPTATATNAAVSTDHFVTINGLLPATRYYYDVGSTTSVQAGGTAQHYFETSPTAGSSTPYRVWVLGDSGTLFNQQLQVRNAMLTYTASNPPDLMLHVGDIAYDTGSDTEFTQKHFNVYQDILRHTPSWHTLGNHEGTSTVSGQPGASSGPYYAGFVLPTAGEAGGEPSGTEAYYSFDYGNTHFICLNSTQVSRAANGPMALWLQADLAATNAQWIVAFWHHPPYSKGSHNSDTEIELVQMRQNIMPILEAGGVDLVLNGHSHAYERSYLIDGTYTTPTPSFATLLGTGHILDDGDGRPSGDGAYLKSPGVNAHEGEVVVVAGHGGQNTGGALNHPVMFHSESANGSVVLDISATTLSAVNVRFDGVVTDSFTIMKGDLPPRVTQTVPPKDDVLASLASITVHFSTPVTGVTANDLSVNGSPATTVNPLSGTAYTFSGFAAPGQGLVTVNLAPGGIADAGTPTLLFAGDSWTYEINTSPPVVLSTSPDRGARSSLLDTISVTFSKPVVNVTADDLTVNGSPATQVLGVSGTTGPYQFSGYASPGPGLVNVALLADGIQDMQVPAHNFAGDSWTYVRTLSLVINEFLASNNTTVTDENGEFDDYLEIFNPGVDPVDMSGMFLTDVLGFPANYRIPLGVTIPAKGHLVFWCDSQPSQGPLHTNFNLLRTGEDIGLFSTEADGIQPIDTLSYTTQTTDVAFGRFPDGSSSFVSMPATPGAANTISCGSDGDCVALDGACADGVCSAGSCASQPINEGLSCSTGVACLTGETCGSGVCDGGSSTCTGGQTCDLDTGQCLTLPAPPLPIPVGATWRYIPGTSEPNAAWKTLGFDDSTWATGTTGFGYGPDCNTPALRGTTLSSMQNNYTSVYTRRAFSVPNPSLLTSLTLTVDYDDAWVAYINGTEVARSPSMGGTVGAPPAFNATPAVTDHECSTGSPANPPGVFSLTSFISLLQAGNNVLAIQGHNGSLASSDFSLIPSLTFTQTAGCASNADCADGNPCTDDLCTLATGTCSNLADNTNLCSDGVACTSDVCDSGACISTSTCPFGQVCDSGTGQCGTPSSTVSFTDGVAAYTGTVDTFVQAGTPTTSNATAVTLIVDGPPPTTDERQTLLRFDNLFAAQGGPIPDGAAILSASLSLNITNPSATGAELHRMLISWLDTDTWNSLTAGVQINGTDALAAADVTSLYNGTVPATHVIDVTPSVAAWAGGAGNFGWVLVTPAGGSDSWQFDSSEGPTASLRPTLSVTYSTAQTCTTDEDCSNFDACDGTETCSGGVCQAGVPPICNDGNTCTTDTCVPATGCVFGNNTNPCNDNNACTTGDVCGSGVCSGAALSCNDGVACTADSCNTATGCINTSTCTGGQTCNLGTGQCQSAPVTVSYQDGVSGYTGTQDTWLAEAAATTVNGAVADWRWDTDDPASSGSDAFGLIRFDGIFGSGPGQVPPGSTITSATLTLTVFNPSVAPAGTVNVVAVDWSEATATWNNFGGDAGVDASEYGALVGDAPLANGTANLDVTASVQAWAVTPASSFGWVFRPNNTDGAQVRSAEYTTTPAERPRLSITYSAPATGCVNNSECDDSNACNGVETCSAGSCVPGTPPNCDDGNVCTTDTCVPATGCAHANNTNACSDGNACTSGDVCGSGTCTGAPISCNDGVACTADSCNTAIGCVNTSTCTGGQTCNLGTGLCESAPTSASFQDGVGGYTATVDTYLHAGSPTTNNALVTPLIVDGPTAGAPGDERQVLLRFDNLFTSQGGPIPDGATITSATLTLTITDPSPDGAQLHRMLVPWADTSTWNSLTSGVALNGVEAVALADVTSSFNGTVPASHAITVTSSVAAWSANPASNYGWVFVTPAGLSNSWQFASSEATVLAQRPVLAVQYQAISGPRARIDCDLSTSTSPPGGAVAVDAMLTNLGGLVPVRGYQTKLLVTRTSGTGTLDLGCPGGVLVDEGRSDFLFAGQASVFSVTNCGQSLASSSLLSGSVTVGPGGAYLSTYSLTVSSGAAPGSTFDVTFAAFPDTALADAAADPIAFTTGPVCTVTITGECSADPQCDDGNPCTQDVCSSGTCTHPPNTAACDDGNACTTGDTCSAGVCQPGTPVVCNDGNACTDDTCSPSNGSCVYTNDDGNTCSDGDACTPVDACVDGACVPGTPISCDDGNSCTADSCSAGSCQHAPSGACGVDGSVLYYRTNVGSSEPSSKPVPNVGVDASGDAVADDLTDGSGLYAIGGLDGNLTITPVPKYGSPRASDHNGAITSFDASLAAQHAVLLITLSPNQRLAADVTGNGTVSSLDASFISQFAIQMIDHFDVATSSGSDWRFLRCDSYADATNNTCGPAVFTHSPLTASATDNFFAILYGDPSGNWTSAVPPLTGQGEEEIAAADALQARALKLSGLPVVGRPAGVGPASLRIEGWNGPMRAGQRRELLVVAQNAEGIQGLDLQLGFDPDRIGVVGVQSEGIGADLAVVTHHDGDLQRIAAYGPAPLAGSGTVLRIIVEARADVGRTLPLLMSVQANEGRIPMKVSGTRPVTPRPGRDGGPQ